MHVIFIFAGFNYLFFYYYNYFLLWILKYFYGRGNTGINIYFLPVSCCTKHQFQLRGDTEKNCKSLVVFRLEYYKIGFQLDPSWKKVVVLAFGIYCRQIHIIRHSQNYFCEGKWNVFLGLVMTFSLLAFIAFASYEAFGIYTHEQKI